MSNRISHRVTSGLRFVLFATTVPACMSWKHTELAPVPDSASAPARPVRVVMHAGHKITLRDARVRNDTLHAVRRSRDSDTLGSSMAIPMSQPSVRHTACALHCLVLAVLTTACTTRQHTELTPVSATVAGSGRIAETATMSEVRVLMRDGKVMTLQSARLALRDDTLHAVVMNNDAGAPAKTISMPMGEVADVQTPQRNRNRSLGMLFMALTVAGMFAEF